jgi:hypothetical protein
MTGAVTGSDITIERFLTFTLQMQGLMGEDITDDRVWFTKSHFPIMFP